MSVNAYQRTASRVETPRSTEHRLIQEITLEMIAANDAGLSGPGLMRPLHRNREMWNAFAADCGASGNGLPTQLRAQIISLALWVDRFTTDVIGGREAIGELVGLNRTIMEGLRGERLAA